MTTQTSLPLTASHRPASAAAHVALRLSPPVFCIVALFVAMALFIVFTLPFPSQIDELQHYSVVRAQFEQPTLFPDWSSYRIVRGDDLTRWSGAPNYINHPSLYYLLMAPLMTLTTDPLAFRLVNMLMATTALLIVIVAAQRRFGAEAFSPALFALLAASFPKAAVVGGMVNNDNLAALAAAALFGGMLGLPGAAWWIMAGLVVAGWTKLTAFIALGAVAAVWLGLEWRAGRIWTTDRRLWLAAAGVALGAIPYLVTFARIGHLIWVNEAHWRVAEIDRQHLDLIGFARWFFTILTMKWAAAEFTYPLGLALAGMLTPLVLAGIGLRDRAGRPWTIAYGVGLVVLVAIHFWFGWRSYVTIGDLTTMQPRYYNIVWPGVALAAAMGLAWVERRWKPAAWLAVGLCLMPTMAGALIGLSL